MACVRAVWPLPRGRALARLLSSSAELAAWCPSGAARAVIVRKAQCLCSLGLQAFIHSCLFCSTSALSGDLWLSLAEGVLPRFPSRDQWERWGAGLVWGRESLTLPEQEGVFGITQPSSLQGTNFMFCSASCSWFPQRTGSIKPRLAHPAPLVDQLWESLQNFGTSIWRRYFALVITTVSLRCLALSKVVVCIKHLPSELKSQCCVSIISDLKWHLQSCNAS